MKVLPVLVALLVVFAACAHAKTPKASAQGTAAEEDSNVSPVAAQGSAKGTASQSSAKGTASQSGKEASQSGKSGATGTSPCESTVTVTASEAAEAVECNSDLAAAFAQWVAGNGGLQAETDCCHGTEITWTASDEAAPTPVLADGTCAGTATVTFTATDACGSTATATAVFTTQDTVAPVIAGGANFVIDCSNPEPGNWVAWNTDYQAWLASHGGLDATCTDACGSADWTAFSALANLQADCTPRTISFGCQDECGLGSTQELTVQIMASCCNPQNFLFGSYRNPEWATTNGFQLYGSASSPVPTGDQVLDALVADGLTGILFVGGNNNPVRRAPQKPNKAKFTLVAASQSELDAAISSNVCLTVDTTTWCVQSASLASAGAVNNLETASSPSSSSSSSSSLGIAVGGVVGGLLLVLVLVALARRARQRTPVRTQLAQPDVEYGKVSLEGGYLSSEGGYLSSYAYASSMGSESPYAEVDGPAAPLYSQASSDYVETEPMYDMATDNPTAQYDVATTLTGQPIYDHATESQEDAGVVYDRASEDHEAPVYAESMDGPIYDHATESMEGPIYDHATESDEAPAYDQANPQVEALYDEASPSPLYALATPTPVFPSRVAAARALFTKDV